MSKQYLESPIPPHVQARDAVNANAHGRAPMDNETRALLRRVDARLTYITGGGKAGSVVKVRIGSMASNRSANGCGAKQNARRNGRLMNGTLTERDFTGRPTAPAQSVESAIRQWRTVKADDGVRVSNREKGRGGASRSFRRR